MKYLLCILIACSASALAQTDKEIIRTRDKYTDSDTLSAKTNDVLVKTAGVRGAVAMTPIAIIEKTAPIQSVALVFNPTPVTITGGLTSVSKVYFRPYAEAILLVKTERTSLPPADKPGGFSGVGNYREQTIVVVPVEWFYKLAASDEWTIKIGDVIVGVGDPDLVNAKVAPKWAERVQPRLRAFAEEIRKINSTRLTQSPPPDSPPAIRPQSQEAKPATEPKKVCFEAGHKVPCP